MEDMSKEFNNAMSLCAEAQTSQDSDKLYSAKRSLFSSKEYTNSDEKALKLMKDIDNLLSNG